jgi:hypothetical protein
VTTPGSALLFPSLCVPIGDLRSFDTGGTQPRCGDRTAMMPKRRRTRAQNRAHRINAERRHNQAARARREAQLVGYPGPAPPGGSGDAEPPPF